MSDTVTLLSKHGCLHTPRVLVQDPVIRDFFSSDPILMVHHEGGDYDRIKWPRPNEKHLRSALYGARETGVIPQVSSVVLPDGRVFEIDGGAL